MDLDCKMLDLEDSLFQMKKQIEELAEIARKTQADIEYLAVAVACVQDPTPREISIEEAARQAATLLEARHEETPLFGGRQHAEG